MAGIWNQMGSQTGELFRQELAVVVKLDDKEQKQQKVGISVAVNEITSPMHSKELTVRLTDDLDPFFLYSLTLSEDDFLGLKAQQGLLVDFHAFPQKFIELLKLCITESTVDCPKFHLQLAMFSSDRGSALLNVVEANPFKHLTHLSLKLIHANDSVLKKYLAECLIALREENAQLMQTSAAIKADLSTKLAQSQELLGHRTKELDQIKSEWTSQTSSLSSRHAREVEMERERALSTQTEAAQRYDTDKKALIQGYEDKIHQLEAKLHLSDSSNQGLREAKYKMEAAATELRSKVNVSEEDLSSLRQEVQRLRQENRALESRAHELEKSLHSLSTRTAVQEQEIKDKEEVIAKVNELLEVANQQKFKAEAALEQKLKQVAKLDAALKTASQEVMKGNEIIQKMQSELRRYQEKVKLKNVAVTQQEKLLGEKDSALSHLKQELQSQSQTLVEKEEQIRKLEEALEASNQELEKSKDVLKTNENVIGWLNKQVNDQMMPHGVASSSSVPTFSKHSIPSASSATLPGVGSFQRPQFTSTPAGPGVRQAFGSLANQQNVQQVMYRGVKKSPLTAVGTAQQQQQFKGASQKDSLKVGNQHGGGSGGEENMPAFLPGKYIAPELPSPSDPAARGSGAGGGVTAPTRATHQYLAGTSPLVTPALTSKSAGAK